MEKFTKILLVICAILVIVLSLTTGMLLGNYFNTPLVVNETNNTTSTNNTANNTTQDTTNTSNSNSLLTAAQAEQIVRNLDSVKITKNTTFVTSLWVDEGRQLWFVRVITNGYLVGTYYVNAETGEVSTGN